MEFLLECFAGERRYVRFAEALPDSQGLHTVEPLFQGWGSLSAGAMPGCGVTGQAAGEKHLCVVLNHGLMLGLMRHTEAVGFFVSLSCWCCDTLS